MKKNNEKIKKFYESIKRSKLLMKELLNCQVIKSNRIDKILPEREMNS